VPLPPSPFVYPILDADLLGGRPAGEVSRALVLGGARLLQVRAKRLADRLLCELAREVVAAARAGGALVVVNDRPDVARIAGADGVHVGQEDLPAADVRRLMPVPALVGLSTHDVSQLRAAPAGVLDYVAIGPVFATRSKAAPDPVVGLDGVAAARASTSLPLIAIGGITPANAESVVEAGADGVAVISEVMAAGDPGRAFRALAAALQRRR
jgi:thiamine-phosphate pyrophosphorylase